MVSLTVKDIEEETQFTGKNNEPSFGHSQSKIWLHPGRTFQKMVGFIGVKLRKKGLG